MRQSLINIMDLFAKKILFLPSEEALLLVLSMYTLLKKDTLITLALITVKF